MTDIKNDITDSDNNDDIMKDFNFNDDIAESDSDADVDISAILENPENEIMAENNETTEELSLIGETVADNKEIKEESSVVDDDLTIETEEASNDESMIIEEATTENDKAVEELLPTDDAIIESNDNEQEDVLPNVGVQSENLPFLKWYDNAKNYKTYDIAKNFTSGSFTGSEDCDTIHIDVGSNMYGWLVFFADGVTMSLYDVKEYQLRQGCLPFSSGRITYGSSVLDFDKVKRIVIYETVKCFSYGA